VFVLLGSRDGNGSPDVTLPTTRARSPKANPSESEYVKLAVLYTDTDRLDLAAMMGYAHRPMIYLAPCS